MLEHTVGRGAGRGRNRSLSACVNAAAVTFVHTRHRSGAVMSRSMWSPVNIGPHKQGVAGTGRRQGWDEEV